MRSVAVAARAFLARGWSPIPVPFRRKAPGFARWQHLRLTESDVSEYFNGGPQNIGVLLGEPSVNLVDIDLDAPEAIKLADYFLPSTECVFGRRSKPAAHRLYTVAPLPATERFEDLNGGVLVEIRSSGSHTIFPPSTHPSGEVITFKSDGEPAATDAETLRAAVEQLAAASLIARHWPSPGSRHHAALALAGMLMRAGWSCEDVRVFVETGAWAGGDEEWQRRGLDVETTARRQAEGRDTTGGPTFEALFGGAVAAKVWSWLRLPPNFDRVGKGRPGTLTLEPIGNLLNEPEEECGWVVAERLPASGISILAGKPKAGKSTLARCLAYAVARGEPWLGASTTRGRVFYLAFEEKRAEVARHFRAMGATEADDINVFIAASPMDALSQLHREALAQKPLLIIVDPLFKLVRVKDANSYSEVIQALEPLIGLGRDTGAHVLVVHHAPKGSRTGIDDVLGSTAIAGSVDTVLSLRRTDRYRVLSTIQRYGTDLEELVVTLDPESGHILCGPLRKEADEHRLAEAIVAFVGCQAHPVEEATIMAGVSGQTALKERALRRLVDERRVTRAGTGRRGSPFQYSVSPSPPPIHSAEGERTSPTERQGREHLHAGPNVDVQNPTGI